MDIWHALNPLIKNVVDSSDMWLSAVFGYASIDSGKEEAFSALGEILQSIGEMCFYLLSVQQRLLTLNVKYIIQIHVV